AILEDRARGSRKLVLVVVALENGCAVAALLLHTEQACAEGGDPDRAVLVPEKARTRSRHVNGRLDSGMDLRRERSQECVGISHPDGAKPILGKTLHEPQMPVEQFERADALPQKDAGRAPYPEAAVRILEQTEDV